MCVFSCAAWVLFYIYGTIWPAFYTFKAVSNGTQKDLTAWAKYWIVNAFIATFEVLADMFISWVPLYGITKMTLMFWIGHTAPAANVWIFNSILGPLLFKHQKQIDHFLQRGKQQMLSEFFIWGTQIIIRSRKTVLPVIFGVFKRSGNSIGMSQEATDADGLEECELSDNREAVPNIYPDPEMDAEKLTLSSAVGVAGTPVAHSSKDSSGELDKKNGLPTESSGTSLSRGQRKRLLRSSNTKNEIEDLPAVPIPNDEGNEETEDLLAKSQKEGNGQTFRQFLNPRSSTFLSVKAFYAIQAQYLK
ncbi:receptor expression-enhancing protein 2-like [Drosophila miranda]|uniref:receptor expression-enhancing protein 2-like n=1 Tax=Drosophila miranda TaxID=7229 RepID=UPI00143F397E|nr:receptor expression-enhancing protein 2-like [Drosophila miranda]